MQKFCIQVIFKQKLKLEYNEGNKSISIGTNIHVYVN